MVYHPYYFPDSMQTQKYWGRQRPGNEARLEKQEKTETGTKSQQLASLAKTTAAKRSRFHQFYFQFPFPFSIPLPFPVFSYA